MGSLVMSLGETLTVCKKVAALVVLDRMPHESVMVRFIVSREG